MTRLKHKSKLLQLLAWLTCFDELKADGIVVFEMFVQIGMGKFSKYSLSLPWGHPVCWAPFRRHTPDPGQKSTLLSWWMLCILQKKKILIETIHSLSWHCKSLEFPSHRSLKIDRKLSSTLTSPNVYNSLFFQTMKFDHGIAYTWIQ